MYRMYCMLRLHGCKGAAMYRMYCMLRLHGCKGAAMYRMYGPILCSCNIGTSAVHGGRSIYAPAISTLPPSMAVGRYMLLRYRHFRRPWRSYAVGAGTAIFLPLAIFVSRQTTVNIVQHRCYIAYIPTLTRLIIGASNIDRHLVVVDHTRQRHALIPTELRAGQ